MAANFRQPPTALRRPSYESQTRLVESYSKTYHKTYPGSCLFLRECWRILMGMQGTSDLLSVDATLTSSRGSPTENSHCHDDNTSILGKQTSVSDPISTPQGAPILPNIDRMSLHGGAGYGIDEPHEEHAISESYRDAHTAAHGTHIHDIQVLEHDTRNPEHSFYNNDSQDDPLRGSTADVVHSRSHSTVELLHASVPSATPVAHTNSPGEGAQWSFPRKPLEMIFYQIDELPDCHKPLQMRRQMPTRTLITLPRFYTEIFVTEIPRLRMAIFRYTRLMFWNDRGAMRAIDGVVDFMRQELHWLDKAKVRCAQAKLDEKSDLQTSLFCLTFTWEAWSHTDSRVVESSETE